MKSIALTLAVLLGTFSVVANAASEGEPKKDIVVAEEVEEIEEPTAEPKTENN